MQEIKLRKPVSREYNGKDINFNNPLNNKIYEFSNALLVEISGGCQRDLNPIKVCEYFWKNGKKWGAKDENVNGIACDQVLLGKVGKSCEKCKFYSEEKGEAPIYEYKGGTS